MKSRQPATAMKLSINSLAIFIVATLYTNVAEVLAAEDTLTLTGRYWDCCKPSCGWDNKADFGSPVQSCDARNKPLSDFNAGTGCNGGTAYACSNQSPWAVNDTFAYGFAGTYLKGVLEDAWCCSCYELKFTTGNLTGKTMTVQTSNTDYDVLNDNMFTLAIPGGNNSDYGACDGQYNIDNSVFGSSGTGVSSVEDCDNLPDAQQEGCRFRFTWLQDIDRPQANFRRVQCPVELTNITGCIRNDDTNFANSASRHVFPSTLVSSIIFMGLFPFI
ncbi:barwin-like endoglucanase [Pseudovirgaria hyperparasitica]|uniref:cellulase n=1 Tax=Pseudovirgaria hyperparasitica TaxID=470096 RepID=A0A6A6W0G5_9PEZI|nr:barwin-like endoglucanase [Pseudovirgaria hyperparasitica]KAF2756408.1 barwin-like endoglucanase [Pseudovirgaria hyperparasitica]